MNKFVPIDGIYIDGIRSFKKFHMEFNEGINILVGPNGVGKSTIISIVSSLISGTNRDNEFKEKEYFLYLYFKNITIDDYFINSIDMTSLRLYNGPLTGDLSENLKSCSLAMQDNPINASLVTKSELEGKVVDIYYPKIKINTENFKSYFIPVILKLGEKYYLTHDMSGFEKAFFKSSLTFSNDENSEFMRKYKKKIEENVVIRKQFEEFQLVASKKFNKIAKNEDHTFYYSTIPEMRIEVTNSQDKPISQLSTGEAQLELLKLFNKACDELSSMYIFLDEPEVHLNYGQLSYLTDLMNDLSTSRRQIFISTHSTYFIRNSDFKSLKYLKLVKTITKVISIKDKEMRQYLLYPEIFFAEKIIIVEGMADSVFIQRTIDIVLKDLGLKSLGSLNISFIVANGKANIAKLVRLVSGDFQLEYFIITDYDFLLNSKDYSFIDSIFLLPINKLVRSVVKVNRRETIIKIRGKSIDVINRFFERMSLVFNAKIIKDDDKLFFDDFIDSSISYRYNISFLDRIKARSLFGLFLKQRIWLLRNYKIENYVNSSLCIDSKLSIDRLNELYYPSSKGDLSDFLNKGAILEFTQISKAIYRCLST